MRQDRYDYNHFLDKKNQDRELLSDMPRISQRLCYGVRVKHVGVTASSLVRLTGKDGKSEEATQRVSHVWTLSHLGTQPGTGEG